VQFSLTGIRRLATGRLRQRLQRTAVTLFAPLRDQRRVQALASQQRALRDLVETLALIEDLRLVLRRVAPRAAGALGDLRVRINRLVHDASLGARVHRIVDGHGHSGNSSPPSQLNESTARSASADVDTEGGDRRGPKSIEACPPDDLAPLEEHVAANSAAHAPPRSSDGT